MLRFLILTFVLLGSSAFAETTITALTSKVVIQTAPTCEVTASLAFEELPSVRVAAMSCSSDSDCPGGLSCIGLICRTP